MSDEGPNSYDEVPYDARPRYATHPDCLATLAKLMGMSPAPVDRCRVLELGCSTGGNLLPLAEALPDSQFVGIDLSPRQIDTGKQVASALGLANLHLEARSILEVEPSFGEFDYVICHGVYSWVPAPVREKILAICKANLAPRGVAYVSYNTYPGWHLRAPVREMMNFHVAGIEEPQPRVQQARALLEFLTKHTPDQDGVWAHLLRDEADLLRKEEDYYLYHEHLEDENHPVYFYQFMQHAMRHDLQFLGESQLHSSLSVFSSEVQETLRRIAPDLLYLEQYLDFLKCRTFRRTLLVHEDVVLDRAPGPGIVHDFLVTGLARPLSAHPELASTTTEEFENDQGSTVSTNVPFAKAALVLLYEQWPRAFTFEELWQAVCERLSTEATRLPAEQARAMLGRSLVHLYLSGLVGLHVHLPTFTLAPSQRPRATALARLQARTGAGVINRRHRHVKMPGSDRAVLSLLDGSRDRPALVEALVERVKQGEVELRRDGLVVTTDEEIRAAVGLELEESLVRLAQALLLVA